MSISYDENVLKEPSIAGAPGAAGVVPDAGTVTLATTHYSGTLVGAPNPLTDKYAFLCVFGSAKSAKSPISARGSNFSKGKTNSLLN